MSEEPENLVQVIVCASMAGVSYGDVIFVDPDDDAILELLNASPPLLMRVGEESGP